MKRFPVVALAVLLTAAIAPAAFGAEEDAQTRPRRLEELGGPPKAPQTRGNSGNDLVSIEKLIDEINAAARKDKERMLSIITINTDVAGTTLEKEKTRTGLTLGDIYVAHSLALATRKKVDAIFAMKAAGKSWAQIARAHKVSLKGAGELRAMMKK